MFVTRQFKRLDILMPFSDLRAKHKPFRRWRSIIIPRKPILDMGDSQKHHQILKMRHGPCRVSFTIFLPPIIIILIIIRHIQRVLPLLLLGADLLHRGTHIRHHHNIHRTLLQSIFPRGNVVSIRTRLVRPMLHGSAVAVLR